MSGFTPGPWARNAGDDFLRQWGVGDDLYCDAVRVGDQAIAVVAIDGLSDEEATANARLIAAAPDLLEALRDMVSDRECLSSATVEFARAAIAKATGETA